MKCSRATTGPAVLDLHAALSAYAVAAGPPSVDVIRPFLSYPEIDLRQVAASALVSSRSPQARLLLERRLSVETSPLVRHRIEKEMKRLVR